MMITMAKKTKITRKKKLIFTDLETGETWVHNPNDWILNFCNFNTAIHPSLLRTGQWLHTKDVHGHRIEIKAELRQHESNETLPNQTR